MQVHYSSPESCQEALRRARAHPRESFSDVVMRARWDDQTVTGGEFLAQLSVLGYG